VFLDECGFSLALHLLYGWGPSKERLVESVPSQRGGNRSVLGAFDAEGMVVTTSKQGAMKRVDVEAFLREDLLPRLLPGAVLVLDNARIHHGGEIEKIVSGAGCCVLYLPPYFPDFSPIELSWGWIKRFVRRLCPRDALSREAAIEKAVASRCRRSSHRAGSGSAGTVYPKGKGYNAAVESFFGTLKQELVNRRRFATREVARPEVFDYIEVWSQSAAPSLQPGLSQPRRVRAPRTAIIRFCLTRCPPKAGKVTLGWSALVVRPI
jgi:transposase